MLTDWLEVLGPIGIDIVEGWFDDRRRRLASLFTEEHSGKACEICGQEFKLGVYAYNCDWCGRITCGDCTGTVKPDGRCEKLRIRFCDACDHSAIVEKIGEVILVRSGHVGNHTTIETSDFIDTGWWRDQMDAEFFLRSIAVKLGANAILKYYYRKKYTSSGEGSRCKFEAMGIPAIVAPREVRRQ